MQRRLFILCCVLALVAIAAAYANHFDNAFHFDDVHVIVNNLSIRSLHNLPRFFVDPHTYSVRPQNAAYRPILTTSFALDYWLVGRLDPKTFHRTQFALLLLLGVLLYDLFRRLIDLGQRGSLNRYIALFGATLFCIHTANTETVNYLSSRSSLLATLGVVGAFVVYLAWPGGRRWHLYLAPMIVGGLAKPLTIMFAPLLLVFVFFFEEDGSLGQLFRWSSRHKLQAAVNRTYPAFLAGAVLYVLVSRMDAETIEYAAVDRWSYLITQPFVWLHYFRLFLLPRGLTVDTDWRVLDDWRDPRLLAGCVFIAALVWAIAALSARPRLRPAAFGLAWFFVALLPTSSLFPLAEVYNEHRVFFPYVGLALAGAWLAGRLLQRRVALAVLLASAVIVAHGFGTHERNKVWTTSESLWQDVTIKSPGNGRGLMNYGLVLMGRGDLLPALELFERAKTLTPNYSVLEVNTAICKAALERHAEAEAHFLRALELTPGYAAGRYFYARWLTEKARGPEALAQLTQALELSPGYVEAHLMILRLHAAIGDDAALERRARETLAIAPNQPTARAYLEGRSPVIVAEPTLDAYLDVGMTATNGARWLDAAAAYRQALALDPTSTTAWNNLGWARGSLGFFDRAIPCFEAAIELDPTMDLARSNLAWAEGQRAP